MQTASGSSTARRLSLPNEHGGWVTLGGVVLVALALAPEQGPALAVAVALLAAFAARGPLDRLVAGLAPRRWDRPWLAVLALVLALASSLTGTWPAALATAGLALAIVAVSMVVRRQRRHRRTWVEALGLAALGAGAGLATLIGGASWASAATIAVVLATNVGLAVPLVRTTLRRNERVHATRGAVISALLLLPAALSLLLLGHPAALVALLPRAVLVAWHLLPPHAPRHPRAVVVGLRESTCLLATIVLLGASLAAGGGA
jgi:hypothetical protein